MLSVRRKDIGIAVIDAASRGHGAVSSRTQSVSPPALLPGVVNARLPVRPLPAGVVRFVVGSSQVAVTGVTSRARSTVIAGAAPGGM